MRRDGGKLRPRGVVLPRAINTHEHFLSQVFGLVSVARYVFEDRDHTTLIAHHEFLEGRSVIVADFQHETHIRIPKSAVYQ